MREPLSAAYVTNGEAQAAMQSQPQARTEAKVLQLEHYREACLGESVSEVRRRLGELQRPRIQSELSTGHLLRQLSALQRELRACRARATELAPKLL